MIKPRPYPTGWKKPRGGGDPWRWPEFPREGGGVR